MKSINPYTQETINEYTELTTDEVQARLQEASSAFERWRTTTFAERAAAMKRLAEILQRTKIENAGLISDEMGKPIQQAFDEIEKCASVCEYYAEHAEQFLNPRPVSTDASYSCVRYDPLGPILAVMPWNFPFWQVFRFAVPTLMAGNAALLKHASNVSGCALEIERIFRSAGFPAGVFTTLLVDASQVEAVLSQPIVRAVSFTGSEPAGRRVASVAAKNLKKSVLELGGSDSFIVLGDADIEIAARQAVASRTVNSGQSCIAAKRFIVDRSVHDQFIEAMRVEMNSLSIGAPRTISTQIGPLARADLCDQLADQVQRSREAGAKVVYGGERPQRRGCFYSPTILCNVEPNHPVFTEETFGPVAAVSIADDADQAVQLANRSSFGLGASIWTGDADRGIDLARSLESGSVFINEVTKSDPRVPFGGVKNSGYGRELGEEGIREFINTKTVWAA